MTEGEIKRQINLISVDGETMYTNIELEDFSRWKKQRYLTIEQAKAIIDRVGVDFPLTNPQSEKDLEYWSELASRRLQWFQKSFGSTAIHEEVKR